MKKIHIFILCAVIVIVLGGCNSIKEVNNNITDNQTVQNNDNETEQQDTDEQSNNNHDNNETDNNDNNGIDNSDTENNDTNEEITCTDNYDDSYSIQVDRSLTGIELIKTIKVVHPVSTIAYDFISSNGSYQTNGTVLKYGGNYKQVLEANGAGQEGKIITIHNENEKMNYQCYEATMTGYMYSDAQADYGPSIDGDYDLTALFAEETNLIDAKVINYQGEPVLYFKIFESGNHVDSWVSLKYGIMIKYQISNDEKVISSITISNITIPTEIDDSYFLPPSDINFVDYSK